jgi:hypothetical protein
MLCPHGGRVRLFKYRGANEKSLKRDLKALAKCQIYASSFDKLNDPHESAYEVMKETNWFGGLLQKVVSFPGSPITELVTLRTDMRNFLEESIKWGVWSVSRSYKHELMWAYYANSHQGFCAEYDAKCLLKSLAADSIICYMRVRYEDHIPVIVPQDLFHVASKSIPLIKKFVGTKSNNWKHEKEVRIITNRNGIYDIDKDALKAIYFGSRTPLKTISRVMEVMKKFTIDYYKVVPDASQYGAFHKERL